MIHLKSTLAISAIMLSGLVAASPFPYARDHEPRQPRRAISAQTALTIDAAATTAAVTAWADPPAKAQVPVGQPVLAAVETPAPPAEQTAAPAPIAAPAPLRNAPLLTSAQTKAEQARRRKVARAARERQMAARQTVQGRTDAQVASQATQSTSQRIDPIGDILRGLGIGKEG